jgi:hypothetical protein
MIPATVSTETCAMPIRDRGGERPKAQEMCRRNGRCSSSGIRGADEGLAVLRRKARMKHDGKAESYCEACYAYLMREGPLPSSPCSEAHK